MYSLLYYCGLPYEKLGTGTPWPSYLICMQLKGDDIRPATKLCWVPAMLKYPSNEPMQGSAALHLIHILLRGPRRPLPHSYGYEPPFLELPVHSIFQTADAGLALEKMGMRRRTVKKVGYSLISAFISL